MEAIKPKFALLLCSDLFFTSKITGTADAMGFHVETVANIDDVSQSASNENCQCLLLDLESPGLNVRNFVTSLPEENRPFVIAFGPHVRADLLNNARQAGCDEVMPRSKFSATLPGILKQHLGE